MKTAVIALVRVVLVLPLLLGGAASGDVLCVGADGHVVVEPAKKGCCRGEEAAPAPVAAAPVAPAPAAPVGVSGATTECGPCTDLPLRTSGSESVVKAPARAAAAAPAVLAAAPAAVLPAAADEARDVRSPRPSEPRAGPPPGSVVLLI